MQLNYKVIGEGEPLIILHGLLGSLDNWQTVARDLSSNYRVYTVDQRNHGRSPHSSEHTYELMAQDLLEFMDVHQIAKAHLLGHSMGGKVIMQFAIEHVERVLSLIVVDMGMREYKAHHDDVFDALLKVDLSVVEKRSDAEEQMEPLLPDYGVRQFLLKSLNRNADGTYNWKFNLDVLYNEYFNILQAVTSDKQFDIPVLFIRGARSNYVNDADLPDFRKIFPKAKLQSLNTGHWVHAEDPKGFLKLVEDFLESI